MSWDTFSVLTVLLNLFMTANVLYIKSVICLYMWPHGTRKNKMANVEEQKKRDVLRARIM